MIALLQEAGLDFGTFDILEDQVKSNASQKYIKFQNHPFNPYFQEVREELKKFSNWPTYPQLYHKGTLIGGLGLY